MITFTNCTQAPTNISWTLGLKNIDYCRNISKLTENYRIVIWYIEIFATNRRGIRLDSRSENCDPAGRGVSLSVVSICTLRNVSRIAKVSLARVLQWITCRRNNGVFNLFFHYYCYEKIEYHTRYWKIKNVIHIQGNLKCYVVYFIFISIFVSMQFYSILYKLICLFTFLDCLFFIDTCFEH